MQVRNEKMEQQLTFSSLCTDCMTLNRLGVTIHQLFSRSFVTSSDYTNCYQAPNVRETTSELTFGPVRPR